jgi:hypothetical protein
MKIICLINDPDVIHKILEHLRLWKPHHALDLSNPKVPALGPVVGEVFDDGWPTCEEPAIMSH